MNEIYALLIISWFGLIQHQRERSIYFWSILYFRPAFYALLHARREMTVFKFIANSLGEIVPF